LDEKHRSVGATGAGAYNEAPRGCANAASDASVDLEAPFRAVIEASPIPFAINDEHQNITYLNPEFVRRRARWDQ
jgi:PAS domain-containing protein